MLKLLLIILCSLITPFQFANPAAKFRFLRDPNYGTHMAPLVTAVMNTKGPVFEMGCGDFSTPLLHAICAGTQRILLSTDTDKNWISLFTDLETSWHKFLYVPVYEDDLNKNPKPHLWDSIGNEYHWGVVLIDHRPGERRVVDIQRLRNKADIIVVHDTEYPGYKYEPVLTTFKYKYVYQRYHVTTTLVSETIDVAALFKK